MTSLNPAFTIGAQIAEAVVRHRGASRRPPAGGRSRCWSGCGYRRRSGAWATTRTSSRAACGSGSMIAMALANDPAPPDRRRADDGARRHDPGAGAEPDRGCSGERDGRDPGHPRPRRGRRDGGRGGGDVRRPDRRAGARAPPSSATRSTPTPRPPGRAARARAARRPAGDDPGAVPRPGRMPKGCRFAPAARRRAGLHGRGAAAGRGSARATRAACWQAPVELRELGGRMTDDDLILEGRRGREDCSAAPGRRSAPWTGSPSASARERPWRRGRVGLRQVHARPPAAAAHRAHQGRGPLRGARPSTRSGAARAAGAPPARCRSSSRTRSPRSTRA